MNHDAIAVYLSEHPEFFNDYPELLGTLQAIDPKDLPIRRSKTLSMAGRLIKRAQDDKEHLKSKLECFVEVTRANEKIQEHLYEIERLVLKSTQLDQMVKQLHNAIAQRFHIPYVLLFLVDDADHYMEHKLGERFADKLKGSLRFIDRATIDRWFDGTPKPVLHAEVETHSAAFGKTWDTKNVRSECLIPIVNRESICGAIAMGTSKPGHFHEGLRTDYLERMADKLGIAIDNILLIDRLRLERPAPEKARRASA